MTAINLAERGMSVTILEKGQIAGEQSGRAYSQFSHSCHAIIFSHNGVMGRFLAMFGN